MDPTILRPSIPTTSEVSKHILTSSICSKHSSSLLGRSKHQSAHLNSTNFRRKSSSSSRYCFEIQQSPPRDGLQLHTSNLERFSLCASLFELPTEEKFQRTIDQKQALLSAASTIKPVPQLRDPKLNLHESVRSLRYQQREIETSRIVSGDIYHTRELLLEYSTYSLRTRRVKASTVKKRDTNVLTDLNSLTGMAKKQLADTMNIYSTKHTWRGRA